MTKNTSASERPTPFQSAEELIEDFKKNLSEKAGENDLCAIALKYCFDRDLDTDEAVEMATQEFSKMLRIRKRERKKERIYD